MVHVLRQSGKLLLLAVMVHVLRQSGKLLSRPSVKSVLPEADRAVRVRLEAVVVLLRLLLEHHFVKIQMDRGLAGKQAVWSLLLLECHRQAGHRAPVVRGAQDLVLTLPNYVWLVGGGGGGLSGSGSLHPGRTSLE